MTLPHTAAHTLFSPHTLQTFHKFGIPQVAAPAMGVWGAEAAHTTPSADQLVVSQDGKTASQPVVQTKTAPVETGLVAKTKNALLDFNVSKAIPALGVIMNVAWGLANVMEHHIQEGHAPKQAIFRYLGKAAPAINIIFGSTCMAEALVQGYGMRSAAFGLFTALSLVAAPFLWRDTRLATKIAKNLAGSGLEKIAKEGLWLRNITSAFNAVAPIALAGLFSVTKVPQSLPGSKIEHVEGKTLREMQVNPEGEHKLSVVLRKNLRTELSGFKHIMSSIVTQFRNMGRDMAQGWRNLTNPSPEMDGQSAWSRFSTPIIDGKSVPTFYSQAAFGRTLSAIAAGTLFLFGARSVLAGSNTVYHDALKKIGKSIPTPKVSTPSEWLGRAVNLALLAGNLGGVPASLFTRFNDWPLMLSMGYRLSALPYGISAFFALAKLGGKKLTLFGLDERALTKMGTIIQGIPYSLNLFLKNMNQSSEAPAKKGHADKPNPHHANTKAIQATAPDTPHSHHQAASNHSSTPMENHHHTAAYHFSAQPSHGASLFAPAQWPYTTQQPAAASPWPYAMNGQALQQQPFAYPYTMLSATQQR